MRHIIYFQTHQTLNHNLTYIKSWISSKGNTAIERNNKSYLLNFLSNIWWLNKSLNEYRHVVFKGQLNPVSECGIFSLCWRFICGLWLFSWNFAGLLSLGYIPHFHHCQYIATQTEPILLHISDIVFVSSCRSRNYETITDQKKSWIKKK